MAHRSWIRAFACVALLALAPPAAAQCKGAACDKDGPWRKLTRVELILSDPDSPHLEIFRGEFERERGDAAIELDIRRPDGEARGTVAVVSGHVMLVRNMPLEPGREIEALDWPLVNIQLAQIVLGRLYPGGPATVKAERRVDHRDKVAIEYGTPSAQGRIAAPWRVQGSVAQVQPGTVTFNLTVTAPLKVAGKKDDTLRMRLQGEMSMLGRAVFPEDAPLAGWKPYVLGPVMARQAKGAAMQFGATPEAREFRTIAEVRAFVEERKRAGRPAK
jgi:hypothetical protein